MKLKERDHYRFCWAKNSVFYHNKNDGSRAIKITDKACLQRLAGEIDSQTLISIVPFSTFLCNHTADLNSRLNLQRRSLFYDIPYFGRNIILDHGQINNCLSCHLLCKKYLESLYSIYDLDLFSLDTGEAQNPDFNPNNHRIQSSYFSSHSFNIFKSTFCRYGGNRSFSLLHNNVRSFKRNLENFQLHLLDELDYDFSLN